MGRLIDFLGMLAAVGMLCFVMLALVDTIPGTDEQYTARYSAYQAGETAREQARQETERVQAEQWNSTLRTWAWPTALGVVLVVMAVQFGRSHRHAQSEQTKRRALLMWYVANCLPAGTNAQIGTWRGELAVFDHDSGEIIPYDVAQLEVGGHRLLTD